MEKDAVGDGCGGTDRAADSTDNDQLHGTWAHQLLMNKRHQPNDGS